MQSLETYCGGRVRGSGISQKTCICRSPRLTTIIGSGTFANRFQFKSILSSISFGGMFALPIGLGYRPRFKECLVETISPTY